MGYNAIYPADAIEAHRAFIARLLVPTGGTDGEAHGRHKYPGKA